MADLQGVHPAVAERARILTAVFQRAGWPLVVTSGLRSAAHQQRLINQGLTAARNSRHLDGTAFDVSFAGLSRDQAIQLPRWAWEIVGGVGERLGLRWGGRFSAYDPFHFDAG